MNFFWKIVWFTLFAALLVSGIFTKFLSGIASSIRGFNELVMPNLPMEFQAAVYAVFAIVLSAVFYSFS